jgi:hypothetical protein
MQGWTVFEILKYAPLHNWKAYEEVLKSNPVLAKMMISGVVYSIGDWIGQVRGNAFHVVLLDNLDTFVNLQCNCLLFFVSNTNPAT